VTVVNSDTINVEHGSDLLNDVSSARLNTVPLLQSIGVVCLSAYEVKDFWEALEGAEVYALDKEVGLSIFLGGSHYHHLLNVFVVADQHGLESGICKGQDKELLEFERELKRDRG